MGTYAAVIAAFAAGWCLVAVWATTVAAARLQPVARRIAAAAAGLVAAVAASVVLGTSRPPPAVASAVVHGERAFACEAKAVRARAGAAGALDVARTEPDGATVREGSVLRDDAIVYAGGWAVDAKHGASLRAVCIAVDDVVLGGDGTYGVSRPDVAAALKQPLALHSGFQVRARVRGLRPGLHHVTLVAIDADGAGASIAAPLGIEAR